jgi:ADP-heptose:LPS heptosyltransferase
MLIDRSVDQFANIDRFAAQIAAMDMVITIDNSTAHLAGALGVPVSLLLPFAADWRWLVQRIDSPWYPTMRLLRQPKPGDWETVVESALHSPSPLA